MRRKLKSVSSLSTLAMTGVLTGSLALVGCGAEGEGHSEGEEGKNPSENVSAQHEEGEGEGQPKSAEGEGATEGEGGSEGEGASEGEGEGGAQAGSDNSSLLTQLGMMRGHLYAFYTLHQAGDHENAATHAKHPESELYEGLVPALQARNIEGFAPALTTLADAVSSGGDVEAAYEAVRNEIARVENALAATDKEQLLGVAALVRNAAEEYKIGVGEGGAITNLHEYQDALGFVTVAKERLNAVSSKVPATVTAVETIKMVLTGVDALFDGISPTRAPGEASTLFGAAARIEIAALAL